MPYLKIFHEKYPNIDINITNDLTDNLIKNLLFDFLYQNRKLIIFITILSLLFTFLNIYAIYKLRKDVIMELERYDKCDKME